MKAWVHLLISEFFFSFQIWSFIPFILADKTSQEIVIMRGREGEENCDPKKKKKKHTPKNSYPTILNIKSRQALQTCRIKKLTKASRLHPQNHWGMIITDSISGADT